MKITELYDATQDRPYISTELGATTSGVYESHEMDANPKYGKQPAPIMAIELDNPAADGHTHEKVRINRKLGKLIAEKLTAEGRDQLFPGDWLSFTVVDKEPFGNDGKEAPVWAVEFKPTGEDPNDLFNPAPAANVGTPAEAGGLDANSHQAVQD